jgi:hypothetical protein
VLEEAVGHLADRQAHVLEADLLADDVERNRGKAPVHLAHHARQHGAVAHAGVEDAHRGGLRVDVAELQAHAPGDHILLAAGVDEEKILLPVVEEAEVLFRRKGLARQRRGRHGARADERQELGRRLAGACEAVLLYELVDPVERLRSDAGAVAQPRDEFAVVDGAPAEGGLGHARAPAEIRDTAEQGTVACFDDRLFHRTSYTAHHGDSSRGKATPCAAPQYMGCIPLL